MYLRTTFILLVLTLCSCSSDEDGGSILDDTRLDSFLEGREVVFSNVIACAASQGNPQIVDVFLYPRPGVSNIRYYETVTAEVDKDDFSQWLDWKNLTKPKK